VAQTLNILIAGGGIGGLTAALCLAAKGHEVKVLEQAADFSEIGAGIQLSPNCSRVLHALGLEPELKARGFLPEATQFRNWQTGDVINESPLGKKAELDYGAPYYHMHRGDLLNILLTAARQSSLIELHTMTPVTEFQEREGHVTVISGKHIFEGDVLVGADGIHSNVRAKLWGPAKPRFTGNIAWRALVPAASLPTELIRPMSTVWWGPGKHFVHYYVRQGEYVNCVCVVEKDGWEIESWTEPGSTEELKKDFQSWHPDIQQLIDHADPASLYKWALYDRDPMPAWGQSHVTLLGDACHPTLPFMAQGAAMAIEDAAVLTAALDAEPEIAQGLQRYETLRKARTARIQLGSRRNATVFHLSGLKAWLRNRAARAAGARTMDSLYRYDPFTVVQ
jgi:salicylate hydroxylase